MNPHRFVIHPNDAGAEAYSDTYVKELEIQVQQMKDELVQSRKQGLIDGLTRYAWWRDGTQYVGTCGTTLKDAILEVTEDPPSADQNQD